MDAELLAAFLAGEEVTDSWERWRRDPDVYISPCMWGLSTPFLHRLRPEAELVAAAESRLAQVPRVLEQAKKQVSLELASPVLLERARLAAAAGARFLSVNLPQEVADSSLRARLAQAAQGAAEAMNGLAAHLAEVAPRAKGGFALGEERYSHLLQRRELLASSASELQAVGERAYAALSAEMDEVAMRVDPDADGWRPVSESLSQRHPASPELLVDGYREACAEARQFLIERGLVTLPAGEECEVGPSPVFWRAVLAVASYQQPPPFAEGAVGHLFVPFPPEGATETHVDQLLADNSWAAIPTIAVHEAYPGHHWQLTSATANPRPLRHVLRTPYFTEGWALYAEAMMRRQGFFHAPEQELEHLAARSFRAARIVADTSLHSGDMSFDQAVEFMVSRAGLSSTVARAEVARYCAWPTQASSYLTGALEIDRLLQRWTEEGRGTLCEFHDAIAASPGLPLPLVAEEVFGTLA